jgi:protein-tyrosine phosphatase
LTKKILFVCHGNIIRSPLAEALFRRETDAAGLDGRYQVDSAAMTDEEIGNPPDRRMLQAAARRGFSYDHFARRIRRDELDTFDLLIGMDRENIDDLKWLTRTPEQRAKIHLLREWDPHGGPGQGVPDPWYGGPQGFETAYEMIERSVRGLLKALESGAI